MQNAKQTQFCGQHLFKIISLEEAESIRRVLLFIGDHPHDCSCCGTMTAPTSWMAVFHRICRSVARICHWKILRFASANQESSSKAQQLYTPASVMTTIASSVHTHSPIQGTRSMTSPITNGPDGMQAQGGYSSADFVPPQRKPSWVVLGVQNTPDFDEIENIEMTTLLNDTSFFQELKIRHDKHRRLFQRWFSPFRFRYCKFVRVRTTLNP
jgi:hypothetical protein